MQSVTGVPATQNGSSSQDTSALQVPKRFTILEYGYWAFILIAVGRLGEIVPGLRALPIAKMTLGVALIALFARWKRLPSITPESKPIARTAISMALLALLLTPFSFWRGASREFLLEQLPTLLATATIAFMMGRSWRTLRGTLLVLVLSGVTLTLAALSGYSGGRAEANTMYDTNDLAYVLVTVLPLAAAFFFTARSKLGRLSFGLSGCMIGGALLLTQSRGAFLGLLFVVVLGCLVHLRVPKKDTRKKKMLSLLGVFLLGAIVWTQLPHDAQERFGSVLDLGHDYNLDPTNDKSRGQIWTRGFQATLDRPYGYGPWAFGMVDYRYGGRMMAAHNSYMAALVELGVVGLFLFLRMYILALKGLQRSRRALVGKSIITDQENEQAVFARAIQLSLAGNAVAGFFLSMTYATVLWTTFGVSMALMALVGRSGKEI